MELVDNVPINIGMASMAVTIQVYLTQLKVLIKLFKHYRPGGGIGRHAGLKILWPAMAVTVQVRSGALFKTNKA